MKVNEILIPIINEESERDFPNPLPIVDASKEFDILDDIENEILSDYKNNNSGGISNLNQIGGIIAKGREKYSTTENVPINQIVAIEPYLHSDHIKALVNNENVKTSSEYPFLLKYRGRYVAADGNNRIAAAIERGEDTVKSTVIDLNDFENK